MAMLHFDSPIANIFYALLQLFEQNQISLVEKSNLKDLVIQNDQQIQKLLELMDIDQLKQEILCIVQKQRESDHNNNSEEGSTTKSLRQSMLERLKLNLLKSNFNLVK